MDFLKKKKVLADVAHGDQTCVAPRQHIVDILRMIRIAAMYCKDRKLNIVLMHLVYHTTFLSLASKGLFGFFEVLGEVGLPNGLVSWIKILYQDSASRILNGHPNKSFNIQSGV